MPTKLIEQGFKVWVGAKAASYYVLQVDVYSGKLPVSERAASRRRLSFGYDVMNIITQIY